MFDTIGTLVGVSMHFGLTGQGRFGATLDRAFMADAVATIVGACVGTNTTTTYTESTTGIMQGGRTGLTAFTTACCFGVALFFAPLFLAIPSEATAPVLFVVGVFMLSSLPNLPFDEYAESIPALITMLLMPLSYSISHGIMLGTISYTLINLQTAPKGKRCSSVLIVLTLIFIARYLWMK